MATGAGKSAIYQLAGWLIDGATLVISPLISLQHDQIESIDEEQPGEAAAIDASVSETKREERLEELADEELEFLFLAPEQLLGRRPWSGLPARTCRCSWWTRRTASPSGATTSAPTTCASGRSWSAWARPPSWR